MTSNDINIFVGVWEIDEKRNLSSKSNIVTINSDNNKNLKVLADIDIDVDEHQIKDGYRYERSKKSEVKGWVLKYFLSDVSGDDVELNKWEDFDPRDIHKNDIKDSKNFYIGTVNNFVFLRSSEAGFPHFNAQKTPLKEFFEVLECCKPFD